jgi:hypothetical protein
MMDKLRILMMACGLVVISSSGYALDPSEFRQILGLDIKELRSASGDFVQGKKLLGESRQMDTGNAANYEGRVEYILKDLSQSIGFTIGECYEGYSVELAKGRRKPNYALLNASIKTISAGGVRLGMDTRKADKLFADVVSGGWIIEPDPRNPAMIRLLSFDKKVYAYRKTVIAKDGSRFCDHIWISLIFDADSKLTRFDVISGGCDDSPCDDK